MAAARELIDAAVQVLLAHVVVDAVVPAFQRRPERLNRVGVDITASTLAPAVIDRMVLVRHLLVCGVIVRVDGGARAGDLVDDPCSVTLIVPESGVASDTATR